MCVMYSIPLIKTTHVAFQWSRINSVKKKKSLALYAKVRKGLKSMRKILVSNLEEHSKVTLIEYASCSINENVFVDHYFLKI